MPRSVFLAALARLLDAEAAFAEAPVDDYKKPLPPRPDDAEYFRNLGGVVHGRLTCAVGDDPDVFDRAYVAWTGDTQLADHDRDDFADELRVA